MSVIRRSQASGTGACGQRATTRPAQPPPASASKPLLTSVQACEPPDRELIEDMALRKVGLKTIRRLQQRFNLPEGEAIRVGVEAAHEARREA